MKTKLIMHSPFKLIIQMSGAPGSGKSSIANLLAQSELINAVVINHDLIKSFFLELDMSLDQAAKLAYRLDWTLAEDMIKQGRSVIIDSVCNYNELINDGIALARKYGYDYKYIECKVGDIDLLDRRLQTRTSLRSQRTGVNRPPAGASGTSHSAEDSHALFKKWENPCRPDDDVIVVDSTVGLEECLAHVLKQIASTTPTIVSS